VCCCASQEGLGQGRESDLRRSAPSRVPLESRCRCLACWTERPSRGKGFGRGLGGLRLEEAAGLKRRGTSSGSANLVAGCCSLEGALLFRSECFAFGGREGGQSVRSRRRPDENQAPPGGRGPIGRRLARRRNGGAGAGGVQGAAMTMIFPITARGRCGTGSFVLPAVASLQTLSRRICRKKKNLGPPVVALILGQAGSVPDHGGRRRFPLAPSSGCLAAPSRTQSG